MTKPLTYFVNLSPECDREIISLSPQEKLDLVRAIVEIVQSDIRNPISK
ncbi:hypothetical protein V2H45_05870 [Tumidithrix elongata RA019]|uniref:Uncharacterized protein n=1 Tax=Tumidithrix elongata BACA0141 TaxID=2716417 RepID=A0AAW9PVH2_9CYAN|nr:hypothetical protein [Tumidithrix elongata RA019]